MASSSHISPLDPTVAAVLDSKAGRNHAENSDDDSDALIASLEDATDSGDPMLTALREQRLEQLRSEILRSKRAQEQGSGSYSQLRDEKSVLDLTTSQKLTVVHFFRPEFGRCKIMDGHLETLAKKHFDTHFITINVDDAPFLVEKLKVRVLPCVISFVNGIGVDRIVGFEGLGNGDRFSTRDLENRLLSSGVLVRSKVVDEDEASMGVDDSRTKIIRGPQQKKLDDEDEDDWD